MKIRTQKETMLKAVLRAANVAATKSQLPILSSVLITAPKSGEGAAVTFAATDLVLSIVSPIVCDVEESGGVAIDARALAERLKAMPSGLVVLTSDSDGRAELYSESARKLRYSLDGQLPTEYPELEMSGDDAEWVTLPVSQLSRVLAQSSYAVSLDDSRMHIASLLVEIGPETVRAVATDGHRLALAESKREEVNDGEASELKALIPRRGAQELRRLAGDAPSDGLENVMLARFGGVILANFGAYVFGVKTVDAAFPPYHQVVPSKETLTCSAIVSREELLQSAKAIGLAADDRSNGVEMSVSGTELALVAQSGTQKASDSVAAVIIGSGKIGCNYKYLADTLSSIFESSATIRLGGQLDPMMIEHEGGFAIIMPMRV